MRKTVLIPASGIGKLQAILEEAKDIVSSQRKEESFGAKAEDVSEVASSCCSVFVAGLPWECTEDQLQRHFETVVPVVKTSILRKALKGKIVSTGSAIIEFASSEDTVKAITSMNNTAFHDRIITCREDRKASAKEEFKMKEIVPTTIFVTNISIDTIADDVMEHFSVVGDVRKAEKITGRSKYHSSWIIEYETMESASDAIDRLHGSELDGCKLVVRAYRRND